MKKAMKNDLKKKLGRNPLTEKRSTRVDVLVGEDFSARSEPEVVSRPSSAPQDFLERVSKMNVRLDTDTLRGLFQLALTKGQKALR